MHIKSLRVKNFKTFDDREFTFGKVNTITGDNARGKSSIAEAITFGLFGVTLCGSPRCDNLIKTDAAKTEVEILIELPDGRQRTVRRCKTKQKTEIQLDGEKVSQDAINRALAGDPVGLDPKTFLAMFNPLFLLGFAESEPKKAREFITDLCVPPHRDMVLSKMSPDDATLLRESGWPDVSEIRKRIAEIKERNISLAGQAELLRKQEPVNFVPGDEMARLEEKLRAALERKRELENSIQVPRPEKPSLVDENSLEGQVRQLRETYKALQGQLKQLPPKPEPGQNCPTCGQKMPRKIHLKAIERWQREVEQVNASNNEVKAKLQQLCATGKELAEKLEKAREENRKALLEYQNALAGWERATADARGKITVLEKEIDSTRNELSSARFQNERAKRYRQSLDTLTGIEVEIARNESDLAYNEALVGALNRFHVARNEIISEQMTSKLDRVSIKLFDVTKTTAEITPVFKLLYDNRPTPFLSTSERIKAGIELSGMVRELRGVNAPIFIDNRESITRCSVDKENMQVFYASVTTGDKLEVRTD